MEDLYKITFHIRLQLTLTGNDSLLNHQLLLLTIYGLEAEAFGRFGSHQLVHLRFPFPLSNQPLPRRVLGEIAFCSKEQLCTH